MRGVGGLEFNVVVFGSDLEDEESPDRPGLASLCSRRWWVGVGSGSSVGEGG